MKLKKILKVYLLLWVGVIVSFVSLIVASRAGLLSPHHRLAQDPANIEKIIRLDLPDIASVESWDNLERGSSCWDCFQHCSHFADSLSEDCIDQLETLCRTDSIHWHKDNSLGIYEYLDDAWNRGDIFCICCRIYEDHACVEYYVDEVEGFDIAIIGLLAILLVAFILVIRGVVIIVKMISRRYRTKQEQLEK